MSLSAWRAPSLLIMGKVIFGLQISPPKKLINSTSTRNSVMLIPALARSILKSVRCPFD